ncbi:GNAT family N-acetyltransferase [Kitasatospora sp. NPDC004240]
MTTDSRLEQANENAAAFWLAQARAHGWERLVRPGWTAVRCARTPDDAHRVVVTRPYGEPEALAEELAGLLRAWSSERLTVEDPYRRLDLARLGCELRHSMAVMARGPGPVEAAPHGRAGRSGAAPDGPSGGAPATVPTVLTAPAGLAIDEVTDADGLAEVERTVVEGFPLPARRPWIRGEALPPALLREPGVRAWLARRDGAPAGACLTCEDGAATGLYWVTTLPEHRSRGIARAVLEAALAARPDRPAALVATRLGEPLYRKLGFAEVGRTHWWIR